jgi:hypothetical protein
MPTRKRLSYDPYNDHYVALGISPSASPAEIQNAFRARAKQLHPDRNADERAKEQFQHVNEAYDILSNPMLRAEYDEVRDMANIGRRGRTLWRNGSMSGMAAFTGLMRGPYRTVVAVVGVVLVANVLFILATRLNPLSASATPATQAAVLAPQALDPNADAVCDPGATISSPGNNASLFSAVDVSGSTSGPYEVDWSPIQFDAGGRPQTDWRALANGNSPVARGILVSRTQTAALPQNERLFLRLTVTPGGGQPYQICEIIVTFLTRSAESASVPQ